MANLVHILEKTISQRKEDQTEAKDFLEQALTHNYVEFVRQLSDILRHPDTVDFVRQAAGLQLKNALTAKDDALQDQYYQRWLSLPGEARDYVKENALSTLGTEKKRPSIAAQVVARIQCAELPRGEWGDSISKLMSNVTSPTSSEMMKESSLEALGYVCMDIDPAVLANRSNEILTAIVHGLKKQEQSTTVRVAAANALFNALEFTRRNFENETERHIIMQVICDATQSQERQLQVVALQCLVKIMSLYYLFMEAYMAKALFPVHKATKGPITLEAMKSEHDDVRLQGIEFWSNVAEEEIDLAVEMEEAVENARPPEHVSNFYAKGALHHIVPFLSESLAKQDENDDEDDWNPAKAAGVCLMYLAQCVGDEVVVATLPFITANIQNEKWQYRDAAVMAFGSILEGPDSLKLKPLVTQALPMLISLLNDNVTVVRDTTAWAIGRICDICQDVVVLPEVLTPLLPALSSALVQEPRVAAQVCWALSSLAVAAYEQAQNLLEGDEEQPDTYILSGCFQDICSELNKTTERPDAGQSNLRIAAYEALMELIRNSPKDCYTTVQSMTMLVLSKLGKLLSMETQVASASDKNQLYDLQSLLCATLQSVLRKMHSEDAPAISDTVMTSLLQILSRSAGRSEGGVTEDALLAVATLVEVMGDGFIKYMDAFKPYFIGALTYHQEYQACVAAVGLVGDLCRALEQKIMPYLDEIMELLLKLLQDPQVERSIRGHVLSVFGDVALSIGVSFTRYYVPVMQCLVQASSVEIVDKNDVDQVDYVNQLRESCLEAYTGIIQSMKSNEKTNGITDQLRELQPQAEHMILFIEKIAADSHLNDSMLANCAGLIGDLVSAYGHLILPALQRESVERILMKAKKAKSPKAKSLATWASKEIRKLTVNPSG